MAIRGSSGYSQSVVAINDFGLQERTRTSPTGKESVRFTVKIDASPLVHVVDTHDLGRRPAVAIAEHLRMRVRNITVDASPSTQLARKSAANVFLGAAPLVKGGKKADASLVQRRYSGGRLGPMAPNQSSRLFNDSGRFAAGIIANKGNRDEWVINVPANRWDPSTLTGPDGRDGMAALQEVYARLLELVPEFGDPAALMEVGSVKAAIIESYESIIAKNEKLRGRLAAARMSALTSALALFR